MGLNPKQQRMNEALDGLLDEQALHDFALDLKNEPDEQRAYKQLALADEALQDAPVIKAPASFSANVMAALQASDPEAARLHRLSARTDPMAQVDTALQELPFAEAPEGFVARVMAAIAAGRHLAYARQMRLTPLMILIMVLGLALAAPAAVVILGAVVSLFTEPGLLGGLLSAFIGFLSIVSDWIAQGLSLLALLLNSSPVVPALLLNIIPLAMLWVWLVRYIQRQNRPATVKIPVTIHDMA